MMADSAGMPGSSHVRSATMQLRSLIPVVALTATALLGSPATVSESLLPLVKSSADRVQIADQVAAAKFGTTQPIDDPAREQQVLDGVAAKAPSLGLDPAVVRQFFRDQIEANKIVQRGLYAFWTAHPDQAPATRPDLSTIRPQIDRITDSLLHELAGTTASRAGHFCEARVFVGVHVVDAMRHLDQLHAEALGRSLDSACVGS